VLVSDAVAERESDMHTLYGNATSGNCWKPAVMLHARRIPFRWIELDILKGESRTPEFLKLNPNGRVPLLVFPDGRTLAESNAMLLHLGEGSSWIPADPYLRAKMYEWLFFEQYSHEPYIATVRFWVHSGKAQEKAQEIVERTPRGHAALGVMERALSAMPFLVGEQPTLADLALYAYTHVAPDGGFSLEPYPAIRRWLERVPSLPGFVPMPFFG
jgi:glutathione S-transferase